MPDDLPRKGTKDTKKFGIRKCGTSVFPFCVFCAFSRQNDFLAAILREETRDQLAAAEASDCDQRILIHEWTRIYTNKCEEIRNVN
jgi:hypothetical protein